MLGSFTAWNGRFYEDKAEHLLGKLGSMSSFNSIGYVGRIWPAKTGKIKKNSNNFTSVGWGVVVGVQEMWFITLLTLLWHYTHKFTIYRCAFNLWKRKSEKNHPPWEFIGILVVVVVVVDHKHLFEHKRVHCNFPSFSLHFIPINENKTKIKIKNRCEWHNLLLTILIICSYYV